MQYLCSLVSASYRVPSIINVWISIRPISQPRRVSLPRPFPARICTEIRQCKCRVLEAIYNCIFSLLCQSLCCLENARPPALRYLCTDAVYPYCILNSSTHYLVCRAVSRLNHDPKLTLTLFVFRILTDYSDASFSFNDLAFFTNWFY